jgi:hypothetical protein
LLRFNPIEMVFSKVKGHIEHSYTDSVAVAQKRHRTEGELVHAIAAGCATVIPKDLEGYFRQRAGTREFERLYPDVNLV